MKRNLNRRRFSIISKKNLFYTFIFLFLIILIFTANIKKNSLFKFVNKSINIFSENFQYQYINLNVKGLDKVSYDFIDSNLKKYFKKSIFLLPLEKISNELKENSWIKNVKLSTNFKDTLFISIEEYKPYGIYEFNNKFFYFDEFGKIIDIVIDINNLQNLIIFNGQSSNLNAKSIIKVLENIDFQKKFKIKKISFINKRRWDIIINNNLKLLLSETSPKNSLINFINIKDNLSTIEMNNIRSFDLRNLSKTYINYKE